MTDQQLQHGVPDPLERVRAQCALVAEGAAWVRIDHDALVRYARELPIGAEAEPTFDAEHHYRGDARTTALAVLCLDAVNFGSGWFPRFRKRPGMSGYFTVASCLRDWFTTDPPTAAQLAGLKVEAVTDLFEQRGNPLVDQLMILFTSALNQLGTLLENDHHGSAAELVASADHRSGRLVELLSGMDMFVDVATWHGQQVSFFKRAQLTAVDLALALPDHDLGRFVDLDRLTIFADNLVPHVLQVDGVLRYHEDLLAQINAGELLDSGGQPEVELRAAAIHAVELLVAELGGSRSAAELDYLLWNRGRLPHYRERPRHRTETWFY